MSESYNYVKKKNYLIVSARQLFLLVNTLNPFLCFNPVCLFVCLRGGGRGGGLVASLVGWLGFFSPNYPFWILSPGEL